MRGPLTYDDVEDLEFGAQTPKQRRRAAATLVAWAEEPHPDDDEDVSPAALLVAAGLQLQALDEREAAIQLFRRATTADGEALPDARCYLHRALLDVGETEEARRLADEIRRSAPDDLDVYLFVAEDHEARDDLREAYRWVSLGQSRMDRLDPSGAVWQGFQGLLFLAGRRRIRTKLGYPPDDLDVRVGPPVGSPDDG